MSTMVQTVPAANIVCMVISGLVSLVLPLVLFFVFRRRFRARFVPVAVGAAVFVVFAVILEAMLNRFLTGHETIGPILTSSWWALGLYGGLSAGLFEETGRLCAFFFLLRGTKSNNLGGALAYGVGHGGIEAVLFCTATMVANALCAVAINTGNTALFVLTAGSQDPGAVAAALGAISASTWLAAGVERVLAIAFHIAASVLVWMSATGRGPWGLYFLAIGLHTLFNFPAGLSAFGIIQNPWLMEGTLALLAALICFVTYSIYRKCSQFYTPLLQYEPGDFSL